MTPLSPRKPEDLPFEAANPVSQLDAPSPVDLVRTEYAELFRFASVGLEASADAKQAVVHSLAAIWRNPPMFAGGGRLWAYNLLLKEVEKYPRRRTVRPRHSPGEEFGSAVIRTADSWDDKEARLAVLRYLMRWPVSEIAALLKVSPAAVEAQLEIFRRQFVALPRPEQPPISSPIPDTVRISTDPLVLSPIEQAAAEELSRHWPLPSLTPEEIESLAAEVETTAALPAHQDPAARRRILLTGLLLVAIVCMVGFAAARPLVADYLEWLPRASPSPTIPGYPTPFPPTAAVKSLSRRSTSQEILQRWQEFPKLWHSLTLDVQMVDYGPDNYIGPARRYRAQGWVLQPDQGIELFGLLSEAPARVFLAGGGRAFTRMTADGRTESRPWLGETGDLLANETLRSMVFPHTSPWAEPTGSFWWAGLETLLDHPVIIFDWLDHLNRRQARLWLEARTGMILRLQEFDGDRFERVRRESLATAVDFERVEPPPELIVAARQSQDSDHAPPGFQVIAAAPTPAMPADPPTLLPTDPAPSGMDPSHSRLVFQFANDPEIANHPDRASGIEASIFADGYYLGQVRFGLPWGLRCRRSADGRRIAFNRASDGAVPSDETLRWFNLNRPDQVYRIAGGLNVVDFTFSPDASQVAAAGFDQATQKEGIFLINLATGDYRLLLEAGQAHSLAFSPDGLFLAMIARLPNETFPVILSLHVDTLQLAFVGEPGRIDSPPTASRIGEWGIRFPIQMGGMESCALP